MKKIIALTFFISMPLYSSEQSPVNAEIAKDGDQQKLGETIIKGRCAHILITDTIEQNGSRFREWFIELIGDPDSAFMIKSKTTPAKK